MKHQELGMRNQEPGTKHQEPGFTLVEMLVVIGIIAVLTAASVVGFSRITASAEKAKCFELVKNVHTALVHLYNENNGAWPRALLTAGETGAPFDETTSLPIAGSLGMRTENGTLKGYDRFGILSPWAAQVIKNGGSSVTLGTRVPTGGTVSDHRLNYAIDMDGDGIIRGVGVGGTSLNIRETAVVWCCGRDGVVESDYERGLRKDDVYSWRPGDIVTE